MTGRTPTARVGAIIVCGAVAAGAPARSSPPEQDAPSAAAAREDGSAARAQGAPEPGLVPAAAAFVPGLIVHGAGHYAAGDGDTAKTLLVLEGVGLAAILAGGVPLAATGASEHVSAPAIPLVVGGAAIFGISFLADVYGAAGGPAIAGRAPVSTPDLELGLGYAYWHEPHSGASHLSRVSASLRAGAARVTPIGWFAVDDDVRRLRVEVGYRLVGPDGAGASGDGSYFDLEAAATRDHFGSSDFAITTGEARVAGRYDLRRLSPTLAGTFGALAVGAGANAIDYDVSGADTDLHSLLLARFGFGLYLGDPAGTRGEVEVYYGERRDGFLAGLATTGVASGFVGHVGARTEVEWPGGWGVVGDVGVGDAYLARVGLRYRIGEEAP